MLFIFLFGWAQLTVRQNKINNRLLWRSIMKPFVSMDKQFMVIFTRKLAAELTCFCFCIVMKIVELFSPPYKSQSNINSKSFKSYGQFEAPPTLNVLITWLSAGWGRTCPRKVVIIFDAIQ